MPPPQVQQAPQAPVDTVKGAWWKSRVAVGLGAGLVGLVVGVAGGGEAGGPGAVPAPQTVTATATSFVTATATETATAVSTVTATATATATETVAAKAAGLVARPEARSSSTEVAKAADTGETERRTTFRNCAEAKEAGAAPLHKGDAGYSRKLDRDGDGVACEK